MKNLRPLHPSHAAAALLLASRGDAVPDLLDSYVEFDDFPRFNPVQTIDAVPTLADYVVTNATAGTAAVISGPGGILKLDAASVTDDQGVQVQRRIETFKPAAGKDIVFECLINNSHPTKVQLFAGLSILDTTIFASGEMTASNYLGFVLDATEQAGANAGKPSLELNSTAGSEEKLSAVATLAANTNIRLGFHLSGLNRLTPLVNGIPGEPLVITNCPVANLAVSFATLSEATPAANPASLVDWYYCVQSR